jgi:uncharacterized protein YndB with AHSA1/START domain/uncharacterized protein YciI
MNPSSNRAKAVADLSKGSIHARVEVAAPPERVFRAITEEVTAWWGSVDTYHVTEWRSDLRVGGRWTSLGQGSDGKPFSVSGTYVEIDPPHRLVHTWEAPWDGGNVTTVRYQLDPIEGGTRVTLSHDGFGDRAASCDGHAEGWERVLEWMKAHVSPRSDEKPSKLASKLPSKLPFLGRLIPPRSTFPADITDEERALMGEHAAYCKRLVSEGLAIAFGPVMDSPVTWGVGIFQVNDEAEVKALVEADPIMRSGRGFRYDIVPMLGLIAS